MMWSRLKRSNVQHKQSALTVLGVLALIGLLTGAAAASDGAAHEAEEGAPFVLERIVDYDAAVAGEVVDIGFALFNSVATSVSVTVTEEIPAGLDVLDAGDGAYNRTARFVVWRKTIGPGETVHVGYKARIEEGTASLPLFAYGTTSLGATDQNEFTLRRGIVPVTLRLDNTAVKRDEATHLLLEVDNPFARPLTVDLDAAIADELHMSAPWPATLTLAPEETFRAEVEVHAPQSGRYPVSLTPRVGGAEAGPSRQVTLTVYGSDARAFVPTDTAAERGTTPGEARRTHRLTFPEGVLAADEQLIVTVPLPDGAAYMPGSTVIGDTTTDEPIVRDGHLLFFVPSESELVLNYTLLYEDKERIGDEAAVARMNDELGVMSIGLVPRLLRGDEGLLALLQGETRRPEPVRDGVVVLNLYDGEVLAESSQTDIEVDAPLGASVTLTVNGELVSEERIGAEGTDADLERHAYKYIAVPLQPGANDIVATAETDADVLEHAITVHRAGAPVEVSIHPLTRLATGRVQPLIFQIAASDEQQLPPADGTLATVHVEGGEVISLDARPDWLGHQVELYDGRGYVLIEPPAAATELVIEANVADVSTTSRFDVTSDVDEWTVLGHGLLRADVPVGDGADEVAVQSSVRVFARGPMGRDTVLTVAVNTDGLEDGRDALSEPWTGDTSQRGSSVVSEGPLFAKVERGLSYALYGRDTVKFEGRLANYGKSFHGMHGVWRDVAGLSVRGFYANEPIDTLEEVFDGDGTGYYRLQGGPIEAFSDDVAIVVRDRMYPHDVVRVLPLARTRYYLDNSTGQIILAEPLPSTDEHGDKVTLRVRYRAFGETQTAVAAGVQAAYDADVWQARATAYTRPTRTGDSAFVAAVGGQADIGAFTVGVEAAHSTIDSAAGAHVPIAGNAYIASVGHKDVLGWALTAEHRHVEPEFAGDDADIREGIVTSLRANRSFNGMFGVTAGTSVSRPHEGALASRETNLGVRWLSGRLRPEIGLKARHGAADTYSLSGRAGVGGDAPFGTLSYSHEWPLVGSASVRHLFEAQVDVARNQLLQLSVDLNRQTPGAPQMATVGLGFTHALIGERSTTRIRGGYELQGRERMSEGRYVVGAETNYKVNDRHTLQLTVDHVRPIVPTERSGFGSSVGWKYKHRERGESEWRFDFRSQGDTTKHALQWRGLHPLSDEWTLRGNALLTTDNPGDSRTRFGLGAAYRARGSALLLDVATDEVRAAGGNTYATEWRMQGANRIGEHLVGSLGYARRQTGGSTTDKTNVGAIVHLRDRLDLLAELSYLRQLESETSRLGGMIGLSYELFEHIWLTGGYGRDYYVGYDMSGAAFNRTRSGVFAQLDFAFDEWILRRLFTRRPRSDAD